MITYLIRRVLQAVVVLVLVSVIVFSFRWLLPGGPQQALLGVGPTSAGGAVAALRRDYGLGSPAVVQYLAWLGQVLHGNLGYLLPAERQRRFAARRQPAPHARPDAHRDRARRSLSAFRSGLPRRSRRDKAADRALRGAAYLGLRDAVFLPRLDARSWCSRSSCAGSAPRDRKRSASSGVLTDWRDLTLPVADPGDLHRAPSSPGTPARPP